MIMPPPKGTLRRPVPPEARTDATGMIDVKHEAVQHMQVARSAPSDTNFAAAISTVALLGLDTMAAELWTAASEKNVNGPLTARAAFGSLYRLADHDGLVAAWHRLSDPSLLEGDMPWDSEGVGIHGSVFKDPIDSLWKAYLVGTPPEFYESQPWISNNHGYRHLCLYESVDGITSCTA